MVDEGKVKNASKQVKLLTNISTFMYIYIPGNGVITGKRHSQILMHAKSK